MSTDVRQPQAAAEGTDHAGTGRSAEYGRDLLPPPSDGIAIQPGKGVRRLACPRCGEPVAAGSKRGRLCDRCALEREQIVRKSWARRWLW